MKKSQHVGRVEVDVNRTLPGSGKRIVWSYPEARDAQLADIPAGTWITETIKPAGKQMSLAQMGYYYAVILPTVHSELVSLGHENMGVPISRETADGILKHYCAEGGLKRNMSVEDAKEFIDKCIYWANTKLGCRIPEPTNER